ncbi:MAG: Ig-like domain-containing protein [Candidatus Marinimicrobia bacterium]|nr:Ig-like domain-containing protein [Candidatus Neomarinimicrobiota bacterium]MDP6612010.1 Ig-like domain-containing protein [Candidatus Neomarinimicrobiota bacterium]
MGAKIKKLFITLAAPAFLVFSCEENGGEEQVPTSIVLTPVNSVLKPGNNVQIYALVIDQKSQEIDEPDITWSSSNESAATVDDNGLVTAKGQGATEIRAKVAALEGKAEVAVSVIRRKILSEMFTSST